MALHNLKKTVEYAVVNLSGRIIFQSNTAEAAIARRDKVNPKWEVIQLTCTYKKIG